MVRWKRFGVIVVKYLTDHDPQHVHVFQDGVRILKFDIENWTGYGRQNDTESTQSSGVTQERRDAR